MKRRELTKAIAKNEDMIEGICIQIEESGLNYRTIVELVDAIIIGNNLVEREDTDDRDEG